MNYLYYFFIFSFLGWLWEVSYTSIKNKKLTNRGFLKSPFCPIYGVGCIILYLLYNKFYDHYFFNFIFAVVLISLIELMTGVTLDYLFKNRYWDYTSYKYNLFGYISLHISIIWGICSMIIIYFIFPLFDRLLNNIPYLFSICLISILITILIIDFTKTIVLFNKYNKDLKHLKLVLKDELNNNLYYDFEKNNYRILNELKNIKK